MPRKPWSELDETALREAYSAPHPNLVALAVATGRTVFFLSRKAGELGLTRKGRTHSLDTRIKSSESKKLRLAFGIDIPISSKGRKATPEQRQAMSLRRRPNLPKMSHERRNALSEGMQKRLKGTNVYSSAKRGRRGDIGGQFFRSAWEANYARYLNWMVTQNRIAGWEYEPHTFWFEKIRRGVRSYTPDFRITGLDGSKRWVEIKGWMDAKSKTKLKRMKKYHPSEVVEVLGAKEYKALSVSMAGIIGGWE